MNKQKLKGLRDVLALNPVGDVPNAVIVVLLDALLEEPEAQPQESK